MSESPFAGIDEKLERSRTHIENLKVEVDRFFQKSDYPVLPQKDVQLLLKAVKHLEQQKVPLRFSVLAGEIIHHLRSCLDHIAWTFSSEEYRTGENRKFIEFPILQARPRMEHRFTQYERKIKGITHPDVLATIERLQPYNSPKPLETPLFILNDMDITDKHRELVLCIAGGGIAIPPDVFQRSIMRYMQGIITEAEGQAELQPYAQFVPSIAFRNSGNREPEAILPVLIELHNFIVRVMQRFSMYLK